MRKFIKISLVVLFLMVIKCINCRAEDLEVNECLNVTTDSSLYNEIINGNKKITYECFGAKGDGTTDDYESIKMAHNFANKIYAENGKLITVYGTKGKTYYIGLGQNERDSISVYTNTDWRGANFIIDDGLVEDCDNCENNLYKSVFTITSPFESLDGSNNMPYLEYTDGNVINQFNNFNTKTIGLKNVVDSVLNDSNISSKQKEYLSNSTKWNIRLSCSDKKVYVRTGTSADSGNNMRENIEIDVKTGEITSPITWDDYNGCIDNVQIWPVPDTSIKVQNGIFKTYTNNEVYTGDVNDCKQSKMKFRNIMIKNTGNVTLTNITHYLDETKHEYSITDMSCQKNKNANFYRGFIYIDNASNINLDSLKLSAHTAATKGNTSTTAGTYDIMIYNSINTLMNNVTYACESGNDEECYQTNMIDDSRWGIIGTNESRNIKIVNSKLNRMDAHRGVHNLSISDSIIGSKGLRLIGFGYFYGNNVQFDRSQDIVSLRGDYGSTWNGDILIENSEYIFPSNKGTANLVYSGNDQTHNFGYLSYFPNLYINNFTVNMKNRTRDSKLYLMRIESIKLPNSLSTNTSLYYFKDNAYFNNINYENGTNVKAYLFADNITSTADRLRIDQYGGNNEYNIFYDSDDDFEAPSIDARTIIKDSTVNNKFKITKGIDTTSNVDEMSIAMKNFFDKLKTYTLTYNDNGGSGCEDFSTTKFYNNIWGGLCIPKKDNYYFKEWNTKIDGTGDKIDNETLVTSSITVYAQWTTNEKQEYKQIDIIKDDKNQDIKQDNSKIAEEVEIPNTASTYSIILVISGLIILFVGLTFIFKTKRK